MNYMEIKQQREKIKELVKKAGNKNNWKERLAAIQVLKHIDCQERKDVIIRLHYMIKFIK